MIAAGKIGETPLVLEERKLYTVSELSERIRCLAYEDSCEWVIIDRIDHIMPDDGEPSPERELEEKVCALRALQEELKIAIVVLTRIEGDTKNRFPGVAFRHEAAPLLRAADSVFFLWRTESTEKPRSVDAMGPKFFPMAISILKQREGPMGNVFLEFSPSTGAFRESQAEADEPESETDWPPADDPSEHEGV